MSKIAMLSQGWQTIKLFTKTRTNFAVISLKKKKIIPTNWRDFENKTDFLFVPTFCKTLELTAVQQPLRDWPAETWKDNYREKKMTSLSAWRLSEFHLSAEPLFSMSHTWLSFRRDWGAAIEASRPPAPPGCLTVGAPLEAQRTPIESYQEIYTYWKEGTVHTRHRCNLSFSLSVGRRKIRLFKRKM